MTCPGHHTDHRPSTCPSRWQFTTPIAELRADFAALGYPLHTSGSEQSAPALIECYPHVALLALLQRDYRVPYKVSRSGQYWRLARLLEQFLIKECYPHKTRMA